MSTYKSASTFSKAPNFLLTILLSVVAIARGVEEGIAERWSLVAMPPNFFFFLTLRIFLSISDQNWRSAKQQPVNIASQLLRLHFIKLDEFTLCIYLYRFLELQVM